MALKRSNLVMRMMSMSLLMFVGCGQSVDPDPEDQTNSDDPPPVEMEEEETDEVVSFSAQIKPVLDARCISCHSPGGVAQLQGIPWDYGSDTLVNDLVNQASAQQEELILIVPGDSASSLVFLKVSTDTPPVGSSMPLGGPSLSDSEIELFRLWIDQGAEDN